MALEHKEMILHVFKPFLRAWQWTDPPAKCDTPEVWGRPGAEAFSL